MSRFSYSHGNVIDQRIRLNFSGSVSGAHYRKSAGMRYNKSIFLPRKLQLIAPRSWPVLIANLQSL